MVNAANVDVRIAKQLFLWRSLVWILDMAMVPHIVFASMFLFWLINVRQNLLYVACKNLWVLTFVKHYRNCLLMLVVFHRQFNATLILDASYNEEYDGLNSLDVFTKIIVVQYREYCPIHGEKTTAIPTMNLFTIKSDMDGNC